MDTRQRLLQYIFVLTLVIVAVVAFIFINSAISAATIPQQKEKVLRVNDRPLLETVEQVYQARKTGYATFRIGAEYYVIENIPKEYVDYSSWYVRMP